MFRCFIAAANTDKLQFKFKFYSYVMWNCVDDKNDNEEGRATLEYLPRGPQVSSYATACALHSVRLFVCPSSCVLSANTEATRASDSFVTYDSV